MTKWVDTETNLGQPITDTEHGSIGFMRVFATREAAERAYPGVAIREVRYA